MMFWFRLWQLRQARKRLARALSKLTLPAGEHIDRGETDIVVEVYLALDNLNRRLEKV